MVSTHYHENDLTSSSNLLSSKMDHLSAHSFKSERSISSRGSKKIGQWRLKESCEVCNKKFQFLNTRHHCRNCGASVCNSHSKKRIKIPISLSPTLQRVCDACHSHLSAKNNQRSENPEDDDGYDRDQVDTPDSNLDSFHERDDVLMETMVSPKNTFTNNMDSDRSTEVYSSFFSTSSKNSSTTESFYGSKGYAVPTNISEQFIKSPSARKRTKTINTHRKYIKSSSTSSVENGEQEQGRKKSGSCPPKRSQNMHSTACSSENTAESNRIRKLAKEYQLLHKKAERLKNEKNYLRTKLKEYKKKEKKAKHISSKVNDSLSLLENPLQDPEKAAVLKKNGSTLWKANEFQSAILELSRSLAMNDKDPETWLLLGSCHFQLNQLIDAENSCKKSLECENEATSAKAYSLLGRICMSNGDQAEAISLFQKSLSICDSK